MTDIEDHKLKALREAAVQARIGDIAFPERLAQTEARLRDMAERATDDDGEALRLAADVLYLIRDVGEAPKRHGDPLKTVTVEPLEMRILSPAVDKVD